MGRSWHPRLLAIIAPISLGTQRLADHFDVQVELRASWAEVSRNAATFEWIKSLGTSAAVEVLVNGSTNLTDGRGPGKSFGDLLLANGFFSPAVEAQRAACRALSTTSVPESCLGRAFAAVQWHTLSGPTALQLACDAKSLRELLEGSAEVLTSTQTGSAVLGTLSVDLPLRDEALGVEGRRKIKMVLCGCLEDPTLPTLARPVLERPAIPRDAPLTPLDAVFRQADCPGSSDKTPRDLVRGYRAELHIKSSEYKATDDAASQGPVAAEAGPDSPVGEDDEAGEGGVTALDALEGVEVAGLHLGVLCQRFPVLAKELLQLREQLEAEGGDIGHVGRWELQDLGLQLAQQARQSPEPLRTLAKVAENFPGAMAALARRGSVRPKWRRALRRLRDAGVQEQQEVMELNGRPLTTSDLTLFPILRRLEVLYRRLASLEAWGLTLTQKVLAAARSDVSSVSQPARLDWRSKGLVWCYHVKNDEDAEDWPHRLSALAPPSEEPELAMFQMGGRQKTKALEVQQPVLSVVFAFDPQEKEALKAAVELATGPRPARVALLPVGSGGAGAAAADAFGFLLRSGSKADGAAARSFLKALAGERGALSEERVEAIFKGLLPKARRGAASGWSRVRAEAAGTAHEAYLHARALPVPSLLVNGKVLTGASPAALLLGLGAAAAAECQVLSEALKAKRIKDAKKVKDAEAILEGFFMGEHAGAVAPAFDLDLTPGLHLAVEEEAAEAERDREGERERESSGEKEPMTGHPTALFPPAVLGALPSVVLGSATAARTSLVLFLRRPEDLPLLGHFASFLASASPGPGTGTRLTVAPASSLPLPCLSGLLGCLSSGTVESLRQAADCCSEGEGCSCQPQVAEAVHAALAAAEVLWRELPATVRDRDRSSNELAHTAPSAVAVCNGLLVPRVPLRSSTPQLLFSYWCPKAPDNVLPELGALVRSVSEHRPVSRLLERCLTEVPKALQIHLRPRHPEAAVLASVGGLLDPLEDGSSAFVQLAQLLHSDLNAEVCIVMNPRETHLDYPLKRWQRNVFTSPASEGRPATVVDAATESAIFRRLRTGHTLTLALVCPPAWLVTAQASEHDLDNIRAEDAVRLGQDARPQVMASFSLSRLYLEGSAHIRGSQQPATGLQLEMLPAIGTRGLGSHSNGAVGFGDCAVADTRVMQNHGFWSVPACPGLYELALVPGASNETFEMPAARHVEVSSFVLESLPLRVSLRPGKKESDLARKSLGVRRSRRPKSQRIPTGNATSCPTIHVFSLASGHLYERLLSIMMLSVRNHTTCPLHFWLLSNFLSPRFTDLLPRLVAEMDSVAYNLVSFKWPSWLNPQKEKQRLIWAYKILFLDVLFPMDISRIIFVDSDLVVRWDLRELWDMDFGGRAYAFTPFCSGTATLTDGSTTQRRNNATTGFRFWDSGYWKGHLGKLPYHISALFVVDLLEFRRQSVGDHLRATYNALTRDPASLANLDQDLPNYAQHTVPIFSLPQEWLWCETWCSAATKPLAKAIDLCQNPQTKEPKSAMARRVVPEWAAYHTTVQSLQDGIQALKGPHRPPPSHDEL